MSLLYRFALALSLSGAALCSSVWAAEPRLQLAWPDGWEVREPVAQGPAVHLHARQRAHERTLQQLTITVIDTRVAQKPVTDSSIKELVQRLRDAALATAAESEIALQPLASRRGYYFVATDKHHDPSATAEFRQLIEGVALDGGYLISFTLLTDAATGNDAQQMLRALDEFSISAR